MATGKRQRIKCIVSFHHPTCRHALPAIVLPDGSAMRPVTWAGRYYQVEKATPGELAALRKLGFME